MIDPSAVVAADAVIGPGTVVMATAVVNTGAVVGGNVILNTGCSVHHDCQSATMPTSHPGVRLSGECVIGAHAHLGIGSCVVQGVRIGEGAPVGAGAAALEDVAAGTTVVGVPADCRARQRAKERYYGVGPASRSWYQDRPWTVR